jgi:protein Mpv17
MGVLERKSSEQILAKMKQDYFTTLLANYAVWPVANFVNFQYIPPNYRVLYVR